MKGNRFIISGGPGSGKTSLINMLRMEGFCCFEEISRQVIREQRKRGTDIFPWANMTAFAEIAYKRMLEQLYNSEADSACFYDRGLPDIIAYLRYAGLNVPEYYYRNAHPGEIYHHIVFIVPPWKEIFVNDNERQESFSDARLLHKSLIKTYSLLGYTIKNLPKASVRKRTDIIKDEVERFSPESCLENKNSL